MPKKGDLKVYNWKFALSDSGWISVLARDVHEARTLVDRHARIYLEESSDVLADVLRVVSEPPTEVNEGPQVLDY